MIAYWSNFFALEIIFINSTIRHMKRIFALFKQTPIYFRAGFIILLISLTVLILGLTADMYDIPAFGYISDIFLFPAIITLGWGLDRAVDNTVWFNILFAFVYLFFWPIVISLLVYVTTRGKK